MHPDSHPPAFRHRLLVPLLVSLDAAALATATWLAFHIRFDPASLVLKSQALLARPDLVGLSLVAYITCLAVSGLYHPLGFVTHTEAVLRSTRSAGLLFVSLTVLQSLSMDWRLGRGILLLTIALCTLLVYLMRRAAARWASPLGLLAPHGVAERLHGRLDERLETDQIEANGNLGDRALLSSHDLALRLIDMALSALLLAVAGIPFVLVIGLLRILEQDAFEIRHVLGRRARSLPVLRPNPQATSRTRLLGPLLLGISKVTRLDRLTDLWWVLCGHLSLVGPDPERVASLDQGTHPHAAILLRSLPPGLLPWTSSGAGCEGSLEHDLFYARYRSVDRFALALLRQIRTRIRRWDSSHPCDPLRPTPAPASVRVTDGAVTIFALWTITCQTVVFVGGVFHNLLTTWWLVAALALGYWWNRARRATWAPPPPGRQTATATTPAMGGDQHHLATFRKLALVLAVVAGIVVLRNDDWILRWHIVFAVLCVGLLAHLWWEDRRLPLPRQAIGRRREEVWLWSLVVVSVVMSLVAHRPDRDDSVYVNFAVSALDHPQWQLLASDMLHGIPDMPLPLQLYRLHSIELWNALLAWLTGLSPIQCFHWLTTAMGAALVPLVAARLLRVLAPRVWPWATTFYVLILFTIGDSHRWYSNFAFVRIWQGKGILLFVFLPMVWTYGMALAKRPNLRNWLFLAGAMIAAVGASSSALWVAPATALMAIAVVCRPSLRLVGLLVAGIASIFPWLVVALGTKEQVMQLVSTRIARLPGQDLSDAMTTVMGHSHLLAAGFGTLLLAWLLAPNATARRFALVSCLAVWGILLNPYLSTQMISHVVGPSYWRALWALPIPLLMALVLAAPLSWTWPRPLAPRLVLALGACAVVVLWIPRTQVLAKTNRTALDWPPRLKVPVIYHQAAELHHLAGPQAHVVAPRSVAAWSTTFRQHVYPLATRHYLRASGGPLSRQEIFEREVMMAYAGNVPPPLYLDRGRVPLPLRAKIFARGLDAYGVSAVCLRTWHRRGLDRPRSILTAAGFGRRVSHSHYEIWTRSLLSAEAP